MYNLTKIPSVVIFTVLIVIITYSVSISYGSFDPVYLHDYTFKDGADHGLTWITLGQVWGWFLRGDNKFYTSEHAGEAYGDTDTYDKLEINRFILCGRAYNEGSLVDLYCESAYPSDIRYSSEFWLDFPEADKVQTKVNVKYGHYKWSLFGWYLDHEYEVNIYYWETSVSL